MQFLLTILSVLVVLGTLGIFLYDLKTKKYDLLSYRNIFLLGFAHFFGIGTFFTVLSGFGTDLYVAGDKGIALLFAGMMIFISCFYVAQRFGSRWGGLRFFIPPLQLPITKLAVSISILALLAGSMFGALIPNTGYTTAVVTQFRGGTACAAMALATYNLLARKFNPVAWIVFFGTLGCAALLSTVGEIGRRGLLGIVFAIGWVWFYFSLRYRAAGPTVVKLTVLLAVGFFVLLVYAGFRSRDTGGGQGAFSLDTRFQQFSEALNNPTVTAQSFQSSVMSDAPTNSMFIMENYPETYPYDPFNGVKFILANPIPRFLWPEKPRGLGVILQEQLRSPANLGVGIIGHGWAEGGFIGIIGYALFFGFFTAAVDNLIRQRAWNPFFIAAIGSSLGNVCALARGETSLFLLQVMLAYFGVMLILYPLKLFLGPVFAASAPLITDVCRDYFTPDENAVHDPEPDEPGADAYAYPGYPTPAPAATPPETYGPVAFPRGIAS